MDGIFATASSSSSNDDQDEDELLEERMWKRTLLKKSESESLFSSSLKSTTATCGVSNVKSKFTQSSMNASWMVFPDFLKFMEETAKKKKRSEREGVRDQYFTIGKEQKLFLIG